MYTKILTICALLSAFAMHSCTQEEEISTSSVKYTFTGFDIHSGSLDDLTTRATTAETNYSLLVVDVVNDQFVNKVERMSAPATESLADVTMDLSLGEHKIYFICGAQPWASFDQSTLSVTWTEENAYLGETWAAVVPLTVTTEDVSAIPVTMNHAVTYTRIKISDALPSNLATIRQTVVGASWTYNLLTQSGGAAATVGRTISIPSSYAGRTNLGIGVYSFVPKGVTTASRYVVETKDASDVTLVTRTFTDVPLVVNQYVQYQGTFFAESSPFQITLDTSWSESSQTIAF